MNVSIRRISFVCDLKRGRDAASAEIEKMVQGFGLSVNDIVWDAKMSGGVSVGVQEAPNWKPLRISRILKRLRAMRETMERELAADGLPPTLDVVQATILADVCEALGMNRAEQRYVVGPAFKLLAEEPCGYLVGPRVLEEAAA